MSLANLKASMSSSLAKLKEQSENTSSKDDSRFWKPTFDKEKGVGSAVIRFLPAPQGEDLPFVKVYDHSFQGSNGKWYIENSLSTLGGRDAVGNMNYRLWNSGVESDKKVASKFKRRTNHYANVLVVNDPAVPENNGKVFLFKYGPQIAEIINDAMFPKDGITPPLTPFDPWEGANFAFRIYGKKIPDSRTGQQTVVPSYEKSSFMAVSSIGEDAVIESIWKQCHSLFEFISSDKFKTDEELKKRLFDVLGPTVGSGIATVEGWSVPNSYQAAAPAPKQEPQPFDDVPDFGAPAKSTQSTHTTSAPTAFAASASNDDDMAFLKSLMD